MRKLLVLAIGLLAFGPPCLAQSKNSAAEQKLIGAEKQLWEAWKNKDAAPFKEYLTDDTVNVTPNGVERGKEKAIESIAKSPCEVKSYALTDFKVDWVDKDAALLTYKAAEDATCNGQKIPPTVWASSLWVKKGSKWVAPFHQETATQ
jgi:hypothetical protein